MTQWKKGKLGESLLVYFIFDKSKCMLMHGSGEEPIVWPLDVNGEGWLNATTLYTDYFCFVECSGAWRHSLLYVFGAAANSAVKPPLRALFSSFQ